MGDSCDPRQPWEGSIAAQETLRFKIIQVESVRSPPNDTAETSDAKPPASTGVFAAYSDPIAEISQM